MSRQRKTKSKEDKLSYYVLLWINNDKEFLEKANLPPILIKNMKIYECDTQEELNIPKKGRRNVLRAIAELKSKGLIREDNAGNVLLTKEGSLEAEGLVEGYNFEKSRDYRRGIYVDNVSSEERDRRDEELRRRIIEDRKRRLEG